MRYSSQLIDEKHNPIASGSHGWENRFENGVWTYHLDDVWAGLKDCYSNLAKNVKDTYGITLTNVKAIGFIAHMDTAPDISGEVTNPQFVENYQGQDITLNEELGIKQ